MVGFNVCREEMEGEMGFGGRGAARNKDDGPYGGTGTVYGKGKGKKARD